MLDFPMSPAGIAWVSVSEPLSDFSMHPTIVFAAAIGVLRAAAAITAVAANANTAPLNNRVFIERSW
jgi:hypothetical protein